MLGSERAWERVRRADCFCDQVVPDAEGGGGDVGVIEGEGDEAPLPKRAKRDCSSSIWLGAGEVGARD